MKQLNKNDDKKGTDFLEPKGTMSLRNEQNQNKNIEDPESKQEISK